MKALCKKRISLAGYRLAFIIASLYPWETIKKKSIIISYIVKLIAE